MTQFEPKEHVQFECPLFDDYVNDLFMIDELPCHALMYYAQSLSLVLEANAHQYGHELLYKVEAENIMLATETLYGINRTHMINYWNEIDRIYAALNLRPIPIKYEYRFRSVLEIN